jgi:hypothetical protein
MEVWTLITEIFGRITMENTLALILASLAAFFTLITGAFAIAVTFFIAYSVKLKNDRKSEIDELIALQNKFEERLQSTKNDVVTVDELKSLKSDFNDLRNAFAHSIYPSFPAHRNEPSTAELQVMINDLLAQIASLQEQIGKEE